MAANALLQGEFWNGAPKAVVEKFAQGAKRLLLQAIVKPHLPQAYRLHTYEEHSTSMFDKECLPLMLALELVLNQSLINGYLLVYLFCFYPS